jgi:predicted RNase H-like HicB family nuclease
MIVQRNGNWLLGQLKELPDVFTKGSDMSELRENILEALKMRLEIWREDYELDGDGSIKEMEEVFIEV